MNYNKYIDTIQSINITDFKNNCLSLLKLPNVINVSIEPPLTRSTLGNKSIKFNNGNNIMKLGYKYSGSKFDTAYKPSVTVSRITNSNYFVMDRYSGSFQNSNSTYRVNANGKIVSSFGTVSSKSFTVNFNL